MKHLTFLRQMLYEVGTYLSSRAVASQVLSAQVSLTSVFGMRTGGPSPQLTPTADDNLPYTVVFVNPFLQLSTGELLFPRMFTELCR